MPTDIEYDLEVQQYIEDASKSLMDTAARGETLHLSQSFSGSTQSSAVVVSLVACPEAVVLKVQEAIDRAVEEVLCEFSMVEATVH